MKRALRCLAAVSLITVAGCGPSRDTGGTTPIDAHYYGPVDASPDPLVGQPVAPEPIVGIPNANGATLMDSFILMPCFGTALTDCVSSLDVCPDSSPTQPYELAGLVTDEVFQLGGTPDQTYNLRVRVNGISEAKYYLGGIRAAGLTTIEAPDAVEGTDSFHTGGQPVETDNFNVYKFVVKDATGAEVQHYYLNSFPPPGAAVTTTYASHRTYPIAFTHVIPVPGGGTFSFHTADRNCRSVDNCGIGYRPLSCAVSDGRMVPNEPDLTVPTTYLGKSVDQMNARNGAAQPFHSQLFHIVVTDVTIL